MSRPLKPMLLGAALPAATLLGARMARAAERARDSRLERDVAIKALPSAVAGDDDRLALMA